MSDVAKTIQLGRAVSLHLAICLEDGTEVESTFGGEPLVFTLGDGTMEPGLERFLIGMAEGERSHFLVGPEDAFGAHDPAKVQVMPRTDFPLEMSEQLRPGQIIAFHTPGGDELPGLVLGLEIDRVTVDFNHPLAGRACRMEVEVLKVE